MSSRIIFISLLLLIPHSNLLSAPQRESWLPFALSPVGQWGGSFSGEYDRRWIDDDLVKVQRGLFRLGGSPSKYASLWVEGGVATLGTAGGNDEFRGDFGPAFGGGWTIAWTDVPHFPVTPFISGRATQLKSNISDIKDASGSESGNSFSSQYLWQEAFGAIGASYQYKRSTLSAGLAGRALFQTEKREVRNPVATQHLEYTYKSGVKPGIMFSALLPLPNRWSISATAEAYQGAQRLTLAFSQWGSP